MKMMMEKTSNIVLISNDPIIHSRAKPAAMVSDIDIL